MNFLELKSRCSVKESALNGLIINPDHIADDVFWAIDLSVKAQDDTWVRCGEFYKDSNVTGRPSGSYMQFTLGDDTIPVYELTMGRIQSNGRYDVTQQTNFRRPFTASFVSKTPSGGTYTDPLNYPWEDGPLYGSDGTPTPTHTKMVIKYETASSGMRNNHRMRFDVADERRGGSVVFVEGRSDVLLGNGTTISDVFDPTKDSEQIGFSFFTERKDGKWIEYMTMLWGQNYPLQRHGDPQGWSRWWLSTIAAIGSELQIITSPFSGGVFSWSAGCLFADISLALQLTSGGPPNPKGGDWGGYILDGIWAIQPPQGDTNTTREGSWSGSEDDGKLVPKIKIIDSNTADGSHPDWTSRVGPLRGHTVYAGESLSGYVSGSIRAGSFSGTSGGVSFALDVWLDYDIGACPYIDILQRPRRSP